MSEPFKVKDIVETNTGARFWGEVASVYQVPSHLDDHSLTWRVDVRATDPGFAGTLHVYPASQLRLRSSTGSERGTSNPDVAGSSPAVASIEGQPLEIQGLRQALRSTVGLSMDPRFCKDLLLAMSEKYPALIDNEITMLQNHIETLKGYRGPNRK